MKNTITALIRWYLPGFVFGVALFCFSAYCFSTYDPPDQHLDFKSITEILGRWPYVAGAMMGAGVAIIALMKARRLAGA